MKHTFLLLQSSFIMQRGSEQTSFNAEMWLAFCICFSLIFLMSRFGSLRDVWIINIKEIIKATTNKKIKPPRHGIITRLLRARIIFRTVSTSLFGHHQPEWCKLNINSILHDWLVVKLYLISKFSFDLSEVKVKISYLKQSNILLRHNPALL